MFTIVNDSLSTPVNALLPTVFGMARSFQSRFREAFRVLGISQSQFARDIGMSRANVNHWLSGRGKAPSAELADLAAARLGVNLPWLLREEGQRDRAAPAQALPKLETAMEVDGVEFTKQALQVAKAFMDLPRNRRDDYQRAIETEALNSSSVVPDRQLGHLAAPKEKKRVKGTQ